MPQPPIQRVTITDLRALFNTEVLPKIQAKELFELVRSSHHAGAASGEPPGTLSQIVEYWTPSGPPLEKVAIVHRYLRPDGTLGASGLPDPKMVFHDGIRYAPHVEP